MNFLKVINNEATKFYKAPFGEKCIITWNTYAQLMAVMVTSGAVTMLLIKLINYIR